MPHPDHIAALARRYGCVDASACEVSILMLRTVSEMVAAFSEHMGFHDISQGRFSVLMMLNRTPDAPVMPSQLADSCGVTKATITGLVDGLEREGLVERLPSPEDRRATLVRLSDKGRALLDRMLPGHFERVQVLMSDLSADERKALLTLLGKVRAGAGRVAAMNAAARRAPSAA